MFPFFHMAFCLLTLLLQVRMGLFFDRSSCYTLYHKSVILKHSSLPSPPPATSNFFLWLDSPICAWASSFRRGFMVTLRHTTVGRTPLDEWSARRRDLYLTTHNTHNRQTSMPPVGFEPTILVSERPKTHALEQTATGIGVQFLYPFLSYYLAHQLIAMVKCHSSVSDSNLLYLSLNKLNYKSHSF
jgi:hypothetical protein